MMESRFEAEQYELAYPDGAEHHWWHVARNAIVFDVCERRGASRGHVLDVGCGRGIVVRSLRERSVQCNGVELGPAKPLAGAEHFIRVDTNALDLPLVEREQTTTILLLDVIEHVPDPIALLRKLIDAFSNVENVIVTVPARPELWSNHDEFYGHHMRYTMSAIAQLADALQARCAWRGYFFRPLYPVLWLSARLKLRRNVALTAPPAWTRWIHRIVAAALVAEYRILPRGLAGTSIIAAFRLDRAGGLQAR